MTSIEAEFLEHRPTGDPQRPYETRPLVSLYDGSLEHPGLQMYEDHPSIGSLSLGGAADTGPSAFDEIVFTP